MASLRKYAMDFLARREHSQAELIRKLAGKGYSAEEVEQTVCKLAEEGLQSDARFAESYVHSRVVSGMGPRRIEQELQQRGVSTMLIDKHIWQDANNWREQLRAVWQKKFAGDQALDVKTRAKQTRFLLHRGFLPEHVHELFKTNETWQDNEN